jgi:ubiquinone/menaquinone biosynthesis C-methylase UbiE
MTQYNHQKDYWDSVAFDKAFTTPFQIDLFNRHVPKEAVILDVGCGYGRTLQELYQSGYRSLHGIDFSPNMTKRANVLYPHLDIRRHEESTLPFPDRSIDAVLLLAVLTCMANDADQDRLISEIKRVLKASGLLYVNDFLLNEDERNISRYRRFETTYGRYGIFELPEGALLRHFEESRIRQLLSGFTPLMFEKTIYKTMNGNTSNGFYFLGKK